MNFCAGHFEKIALRLSGCIMLHTTMRLHNITVEDHSQKNYHH